LARYKQAYEHEIITRQQKLENAAAQIKALQAELQTTDAATQLRLAEELQTTKEHNQGTIVFFRLPSDHIQQIENAHQMVLQEITTNQVTFGTVRQNVSCLSHHRANSRNGRGP
jgi:hypothetical protein